jgi:hypothetical protein
MLVGYWYKESPHNEWSLVTFPLVWLGAMSYGTVDELPGQFHVATRFFHVFGCPLVPLNSYVLDARTGDRYPIGLRLKSVVCAWIRTALVVTIVAACVAVVGGISLIANGRPPAPVATIVFAGCAIALAMGLLRLIALWQRASPQRAAKLANVLGYSETAAASDAENIASATEFEESKCVRCGRTLAASTRICPRCEARQW